MYALIIDGAVAQYPYSIEDLKRANPLVSIPASPTAETLAEFGVVPVVVTGHPTATHAQNIVEGTPQFSEDRNRWEQVWSVVEADAEEAAQRVRTERNQLLVASDWTQGKDIAEALSAPWAVYRQDLRDITAQPGFPWDVQWPVAP